MPSSDLWSARCWATQRWTVSGVTLARTSGAPAAASDLRNEAMTLAALRMDSRVAGFSRPPIHSSQASCSSPRDRIALSRSVQVLDGCFTYSSCRIRAARLAAHARGIPCTSRVGERTAGVRGVLTRARVVVIGPPRLEPAQAEAALAGGSAPVDGVEVGEGERLSARVEVDAGGEVGVADLGVEGDGAGELGRRGVAELAPLGVGLVGAHPAAGLLGLGPAVAVDEVRA